MKIAIYTENLLLNSGGAEVYALKLADALSYNHSVTIITRYVDKIDVKSIYHKYNSKIFPTIQLKRCVYKSSIMELLSRIFFWYKLKYKIERNKYDYYINTSCNRMMGVTKTYSIHLIHFPVQPYSKVFKKFIGKYLDNKYKKSYKQFWTNSRFTESYLRKWWGLESIVVNPPIDMKRINEEEIKKKQNTIIMVGRLVPDKKIKELVELFLSIKTSLTGFELIIVGNQDSNYLEYYYQLKEFANQNDCIKILTDVSYNVLVSEYKRAKIFWHGKGFDVDENNPLLMEHFGMTTVEAMANGCVPVVINKAGQKEIVENKISGYLWDDLEQLKEFTLSLSNDEIKLEEFSKNAIKRSESFLMPAFSEKINSLIK